MLTTASPHLAASSLYRFTSNQAPHCSSSHQLHGAPSVPNSHICRLHAPETQLPLWFRYPNRHHHTVSSSIAVIGISISHHPRSSVRYCRHPPPAITTGMLCYFSCATGWSGRDPSSSSSSVSTSSDSFTSEDNAGYGKKPRCNKLQRAWQLSRPSFRPASTSPSIRRQSQDPHWLQGIPSM